MVERVVYAPPLRNTLSPRYRQLREQAILLSFGGATVLAQSELGLNGWTVRISRLGGET